MNGTFALSDPNSFAEAGEPCAGEGGYTDIRRGAQVVVKDEDGGVIASSDLGAGVYEDGSVAILLDCVFPFEVTVPDADFYSFQVSHRGELTYSKEELEATGWEVAFSLGD